MLAAKHKLQHVYVLLVVDGSAHQEGHIEEPQPLDELEVRCLAVQDELDPSLLLNILTHRLRLLLCVDELFLTVALPDLNLFIDHERDAAGLGSDACA